MGTFTVWTLVPQSVGFLPQCCCVAQQPALQPSYKDQAPEPNVLTRVLRRETAPTVVASWLILLRLPICSGFPEWLLEVPGVEFRTDNEPFKVTSYALS